MYRNSTRNTAGRRTIAITRRRAIIIRDIDDRFALSCDVPLSFASQQTAACQVQIFGDPEVRCARILPYSRSTFNDKIILNTRRGLRAVERSECANVRHASVYSTDSNTTSLQEQAKDCHKSKLSTNQRKAISSCHITAAAPVHHLTTCTGGSAMTGDPVLLFTGSPTK